MPQLRALCPAVWHLLQTRALFAGGWWLVGTERGAVLAVDVVADGKHTAGFGPEPPHGSTDTTAALD